MYFPNTTSSEVRKKCFTAEISYQPLSHKKEYFSAFFFFFEKWEPIKKSKLKKILIYFESLNTEYELHIEQIIYLPFRICKSYNKLGFPALILDYFWIPLGATFVADSIWFHKA